MRPPLKVAAALAATAVVLPAAAAGAHSSVPWFGTYEVAVAGGSQDASWSLNHVPTSRCDAPAMGSGSDDQAFLPGGGRVVQLGGAGSAAFPSLITGLALSYTENREGSITTSQPEDPNPADCLIASGGETAAPPKPDCGTKSFSTTIEVSPGPGAASIQEDPSASAGNGPQYEDCPVFGDVVPAFATPVAATLPPLGPAADGGVPSGVATLDATEPITSDPGVSGQSTLKLELRFTRLFVVDALGMPADATATVGASGSVDVPVTCPPGAACTGTVSLDIGAAGATSRRAVASSSAVRFPAPVTEFAVALASARIHLRPHQHGVVLHLHGGRAFARSLSAVPLAVVVSTGSGRRSARYIAGRIHLRP